MGQFDIVNKLIHLTNILSLHDNVTKNINTIIDDLSSNYTILLLTISLLIITNLNNFIHTNKFINCLVPAYFTKNYEEYTNQICFISTTYYINENENFLLSYPLQNETTKSLVIKNFEKNEIKYYIWIPYFLLAKIILFLLPKLIWNQILDFKINMSLKEISNFDKNSKLLNDYLINNIFYCQVDGKTFFKRKQLYIYYLFIKFLYLVILLLLIFVCNNLLGYGWKMHMPNGSPYFPLKTLCNFYIFELTRLHRYTVMCTLLVNFFNQYILLILNLWYFILFFLNLFSIFYCCLYFYLPSTEIEFIYKKLNLAVLRNYKSKGRLSKNVFSTFYFQYFNSDIIFLLRYIDMYDNNNVLVQNLLFVLWERYNKKIFS
jgi:hypothetical protein